MKKQKRIWLGMALGFLALLAGIQACNKDTNPAFATHPCPNTGSFGSLDVLTRTSVGPCTVFASPFTLAQAGDVYQLEAFGMAGTFDVGLYADNGGVPGNLLASSGDVSGAGAGQAQTIALPGVQLSPGTYWLAFGSQGAVTFGYTGGNTLAYGPGCGTHGLPSKISTVTTTAGQVALKADYCF